MPKYITEYKEFPSEFIDGFEVVEETDDDFRNKVHYAIVGAVENTSLEVHSYGFVYDNEYMSRERFFEKIKKRERVGSFLVLRLFDKENKKLMPIEKEGDLSLTNKIVEIKL